MKKSMDDFTIIHHFKKDEKTFLKKQAEILGEILADEVMKGNLTLHVTTDKQT